MRTINLKTTWKFLVLIFVIFSCKDYESQYTDMDESRSDSFQGTIIDYLEKGDIGSKSKFDSMLVVINGIPGLRDSLNNPDANLTLFAVPNESFQEAFLRLNNFRNENKKGAKISLNNLLIDPFIVIEKQQGETSDADSIIIEHKYDYRLQLDSMVSKYIFRGFLNTDSLSKFPNGWDIDDYKYRYRMNIAAGRVNASGIESMGKVIVVLNDRNNTQLPANWDRSEAETVDIKTKNGVIHILSKGHEFSFSKLISRFQNYGNEYIYE